MMISLDTETTGVDLRHGAKPFLVTMTDEEGETTFWEWDVDPLTREPVTIDKDLREIQSRISDAEYVVLQNAKFDVCALRTIFDGNSGRPKLWWDWSKVHDTLLAGHLLCSNQPHDLTTMALVYLGVNIQQFEDNVEKVTQEARRLAKKLFPSWRIAKVGEPDMPSVKEKTWKIDMWLPRAIAKAKRYPDNHPFWTICSEYANPDSIVTLPLFKEQQKQLMERGLWEIYLERLKLLPIVSSMESRGVTISKARTDELEAQYTESSTICKQICLNVADNEIDELPVNGVSNALKYVIFDKFKLVSDRKTKKGNASLDKYVLDSWALSLPRNGKPYTFIKNLRAYRRRQTALGFIKSYKRFWLPVPGLASDDWRILYPSLNPTGTNTLRFSSNNPNEQQFSKQEIAELDDKGHSSRYMLGPAPGREWWSCDAKNIELRLPAYEAGETEMIKLFEHPDDPPYFGSNHLLVCHILHPEKFEECIRDGVSFKDRYKATWYQWVKNGNFAVQYGAVEQSGTADRAYHVEYAQHRIQQRFSNIAKLNQKMIDYAERNGYVETIPDKTVNPKRGYPLYCTRSPWGKVLPTIPLNYHTQGSAMWWMMKAMIRCHAYLQERNSSRKPEYHAYIVMQVHDELVFDFPKSAVDPTTVKDWKTDKFNYLRTNLPDIRKLMKLMEQGGDDIGIPTPVSCEYHPETWEHGVAV